MICKNCNIEFNDSQNFCHECGAKVIRNRLTPKILAKQVNEQFISIDNKFLQTFIYLFKDPGRVIDGYINGLRKRYIGVISYYAIALTLLGFQVFLLKTFFADFFETQSNTMMSGFNAGTNGQSNPLSEGMGSAFTLLNNYQGVLFSIFMPFMAIGSWVMFLDKPKYNYTEHLVINIYTNAQLMFVNFVLYMLFALLSVENFIIASLFITPVTILYGTYAFKKLYHISFINALFRYIGAFIIYLFVFTIVLIIFMIVLLIYLFATGKF